MYVARFSSDPISDLERGWSGFFGESYDSPEQFVREMFSDELEDDDLIQRQERWIRTYGSEYEDYDLFLSEYCSELAEERGLCYDKTLGKWRVKHHDGLSCWALEAQTVEEAVREALSRNDVKWGGFGQRTLGKVRLVCAVPNIDNLYIFECEDVEDEH